MADFLNVPQQGTAEYDKWVKQQQTQLAKATAAFAKANPTASPGVALAAAKSGVNANSSLASSITTTDITSKVNAQRNAALAAAAALKQSNGKTDGSPMDWLAPITRTAFMALSTPYELLESAVRNVAGGKMVFNNLLGQTSAGQAMEQLLKTGHVDVGTGFLDVDPNSAVGKAMLKAKITAGPRMKGGQPWTYQSGLTQALFDNPETKAAKVFQAVSGFVFNIALDPTTYVPGLGLVKIGKKLTPAELAKGVMRDTEGLTGEVATLGRVAKTAAEETSGLHQTVSRFSADVKDALATWRSDYDLIHRVKNEHDLAEAEYGSLLRARDAAYKDLKSAEQASVAAKTERKAAEDVVAKRAELGTAGRTADVDAILTAKGDEAVLREAATIKSAESVLPGMVHTAEEAALKKGGRVPTLGIVNGAEQVVRVAGAKKPRLLKLTQEVMAGTSAAAQKVGNALADALAPLGDRANSVLETIVRDGATHEDVVKAAKKAGILDDVYAAYQKIGVDGFSNVGTVRGAGGGSFAYFRPVVDSFAHDVSWWATHKQVPVHTISASRLRLLQVPSASRPRLWLQLVLHHAWHRTRRSVNWMPLLPSLQLVLMQRRLRIPRHWLVTRLQ